MVIIFSQKFEPSTAHVMDWLAYLNKPVIRINNDDEAASDIDIHISNDYVNCKFVYKKQLVDISSIDSYWYRRGGLTVKSVDYNKLSRLFSPEFVMPVSSALRDELFHFTEFIYLLLRYKKPKIGDPFKCSPNKLIVLHKAALAGLCIPKTLLTNSKKSLALFFSSFLSIVTKPISGGVFIRDRNKTGHYFAYTEIISEDYLESFASDFFPSKFQEYIDKVLELRIFFLGDVFYSMAIFSQSDEKTKVDFRKYNREKPNRTVPYKLPLEIEEKLRTLMFELELESGSIDMIVTKDDEYVFLEVNPVGQFGMVSEPCNYYLEMEIAKYLSK
jgi:ATP-GRASP peptide maturase of grasp-with-spasm system